MNHDYAHCSDFSDDCPKKCFRAKLARDLRNNPSAPIWISWVSFWGTEECRKNRGKNRE